MQRTIELIGQTKSDRLKNMKAVCSTRIDRAGSHKMAKLFSLLLVLFAAGHLACKAQVGPERIDVRPFAPLDGTAMESVSTANGSLVVDIPIWSVQQRGKVKLDFSLAYDSPTFVRTYDCDAASDNVVAAATSQKAGATPLIKPPADRCNYPNCPPPNYIWGSCSLTWDLEDGDPLVPFTLHMGIRLVASTDVAVTPILAHSVGPNGPLTGYYWQLTTPDGGRHKMVASSNESGVFRVADGTGWRYQASSCTLTDRDGINYVFSCTATTAQLAPLGYMPGVLLYEQDSNGNKITLNYTTQVIDGNTLYQLTGWTDTENRSIPYSTATTNTTGCPTGSVSASSWQPPGLSTPFTFCATTVGLSTHFFGGAGYPDDASETQKFEYVGSFYTLSAVILPSGENWAFAYSQDGYGDLASMTLPTGGSINYLWDTQTSFCGVNAPVVMGRPSVIQRQIYESTGGQPMTWLYSAMPEKSATTNQVYQMGVTDPLGNSISRTFTNLGDPSYAKCSFFETSASFYDNQNNLLRTDNTDYQALPLVGPYPTALWSDPLGNAAVLPLNKYTVWPNGSVKKTTYTYDQGFATRDILDNAVSVSYGNQLSSTDYDYGAGAAGGALRQILTSYAALGGPNPTAYLNRNLLSLPYTTETLDGSGNSQSLTTYTYDESTYLASPGIFGNLTTTTKSLGTGGTVATHGYYDGNGMVTQIIDPNGKATSYTYQCSDSLPLLITNALGQSTTYSYSCDSGLLASVQDPNDAAAGRSGTVYNYDFANNLTQIKNPIPGSITTYDYHSYALPFNVTTTTTADPDPAIVSSRTYDGLGRLATSTAPGGAITKTTYDGDSRVYSVSNPYFAAAPTSDITTYTYDGLGRKTLETEPDSATQQWSYSANVTSFTDEVGNSWQRTADSLERLTNVIEPGGLNTSYGYDGLNNLTSVSQVGNGSTDTARVRSFTYDSLSRLLTSTNPETGTVYYGQLVHVWHPVGSPGATFKFVPGYDANGNLLYKTDARGITTNYSYDALNRLVSKTYTHFDGAASTTPASCYQYDQTPSSASNVTIANPVGRLTAEWTQSGACPSSGQLPSSGFLTSKLILGYDPMGRVKGEKQCTSSGCSSPYSFAYDYDLAGNVTGANNGVGSITWQPTYDSAGRLLSVGSLTAWSGPQFSTQLFSSPTYGPLGITGWSMGSPVPGGSVSPLTFQKTYDKRQRVASETVTGNR